MLLLHDVIGSLERHAVNIPTRGELKIVSSLSSRKMIWNSICKILLDVLSIGEHCHVAHTTCIANRLCHIAGLYSTLERLVWNFTWEINQLNDFGPIFHSILQKTMYK
jgi:hypothetical protein